MPKLARLSMKDRLVAALRGKILNGELPAHSRITEQGLADEFGVSRSVVRETMLALEIQGLLVSTPYKGTEVASVTQSEVRDFLLPVRCQIEQYALRAGLERFDAETFDRFGAVLDTMARAVADKDVVAFNDADMDFHALIVESAGSDAALAVWDAIQMRIRMHWSLQTGRTGPLHQFLLDHRALVEVFRTGDLERSLTAIAEHVIDSNLRHLDVLDQEDAEPDSRSAS
ncbi:GntR family transcriptional regulator [Streptomyces sp. NPDC005840]|uniref:GntR family transcriptional regulator n=1 Tax=Streptomyces sp. NPDC005840 TaxID=3157072 RepID=UPI00340AB510